MGYLPGSWLAAHMADLTPDLQVSLSWRSTAKIFHSLLLPCHLGSPWPMLSINLYVNGCLDCTTCSYQWSLLSFRMRSRSLMPSLTSSSLNLVGTMSCGLTLQICLIIALSFRCRCWRFGFVNGQVSLAWSIAFCTQELYMWPRVVKEWWQEERIGSSSLNFFQELWTSF